MCWPSGPAGALFFFFDTEMVTVQKAVGSWKGILCATEIATTIRPLCAAGVDWENDVVVVVAS